MKRSYTIGLLAAIMFFQACTKEKSLTNVDVLGNDVLLQDAKAVAADYVDIFTINNYEAELPAYLRAIGMTIPDQDSRKIELGRVLFYDRNLSSDRTISCASCHKQEFAFGDNTAFSIGVDGHKSTRNSMALGNVALFGAHHSSINGIEAPALLWDGRAANVTEQAPMAFTNPHEMNMTMEGIVERVKSAPWYPYFFRNAYGSDEVTEAKIKESLQAFVDGIGATKSKLDIALEEVAGDINAAVEIKDTIVAAYYGNTTITTTVIPLKDFTINEMRGRDVFVQFCTKCHSPLRPIQEVFMACNGLDMEYQDAGLGGVSGKSTDNGVFKSPSLRNIELTAPYMHDGRFKTLQEVVDFYSTGVKPHANLHSTMKEVDGTTGMNLSVDQKNNLIAFMKTFTDRSIRNDTRFSDPFWR